MLLWLWYRLAAAALIQPLAQEFPYATGAAIQRKKLRKKKENNIQPQPPVGEISHAVRSTLWPPKVAGRGQPWPCKIFPGSWLVSYSYTGAHVLFTPFRWHFWVHLGWSARCQMSDSGFYPPCSAATAPGWPAHRMWTHQGQVAAFFQRMKRWCTWHPPEKPCGKTSSTPYGDAGSRAPRFTPENGLCPRPYHPGSGVWGGPLSVIEIPSLLLPGVLP